MRRAAEGHLTTEALMWNQNNQKTISGMSSEDFRSVYTCPFLSSGPLTGFSSLLVYRVIIFYLERKIPMSPTINSVFALALAAAMAVETSESSKRDIKSGKRGETESLNSFQSINFYCSYFMFSFSLLLLSPYLFRFHSEKLSTRQSFSNSPSLIVFKM